MNFYFFETTPNLKIRFSRSVCFSTRFVKSGAAEEVKEFTDRPETLVTRRKHWWREFYNECVICKFPYVSLQ